MKTNVLKDMDTSEIKNLAQRRQEDWQEVLLYERLREGPGGAEGDTTPEWNETLNQLDIYLKKKHNRRRLMTRLLSETEALKGCTDEEFDRHLRDATLLCKKIIDNTKTDPTPWQQNLLRDVGYEVHKILLKQTREQKSMEELFQDFLNAGQRESDPADPDGSYLVTDHHGETTSIPKTFVPITHDWTLDKILADPDWSERRRFKSNACVRLKTDKYGGIGLPKGIEGYVSGVVSNEYLGWEANYCHVMFILACEEDTTTVQDFLEVQEGDLQLCNKKHPPSLFFPYEVAENGQAIWDQQLGRFKRHTKSKAYTYDDLVDFLREESREKSDRSEGEKSSSSIPLKGNPDPWGAFKQKVTKGLKALKRAARGEER